MKKIYFLLLIVVLFFENNTFAQCPGCALNTSCIVTPAYPSTCPLDTLPSGMAGQVYDNDITFYMPEIFEVTSPITQNVHLDELVINNVTGLPTGLNWQTNSTDNTYHPSAGNEHGCAKVCGTPLFPGVYNVTIFFQVTVTPQSVGSVTTENESSTMVMIVSQNPSGNSAFTISNPQGCAPLITDFNPVVTSGGSPLYTYSWDFGNGNTSISENPSTQTYTNAGTYIISQTTNMLAYRLTDVTFDVGSNTNWCGDVDEPDIFGCSGSPDFVFELRDSSTSSIIYTSSEVSNSMTGSWNNINLQLQNQTYTIQFWDIDAVSANDNLGIFTITPTATGTFNFSGGGVSGTYIIDTEIINSLSDTDSVTVFPVPTVLSITATPNDSICFDQTITLTVPNNGYNYQWYNDTTLLYNAIDTFLILNNASGSYWVNATNQYGCSSVSQPVNINFIENPYKPTFGISANTLTCYLTDVTFQWYQNGILINGATNNSYTITVSDYYSLVVTNSFGCYNNSDTVFVTAFPVPPVLTITSAPNDSACSDQTITLTVSGGYYYQWYNDTSLLNNAIDSFITLNNTSGDYWVNASNQYGCSSESQHIIINFIENPPKPIFGIVSNTLTCYLTDVTFQWYQNGILINGATNNSYTITVSDYYSLVVENSFGCMSFSDTVFVTFGAISENLFVNNFSIFPNPNNGEFAISFNMIAMAEINITVLDITGRIVFQKNEGEFNGKFERLINLSDLNKGMYLFNLQVGTQQINKRFVIQ